MSRLLCLALIVLAGVARRPVFAQDPPGLTVLTGGVDEYVVHLGDTLASVSARFGTDSATLVQLNKLDQGRPVVTRVPPSPSNPLGGHWIRLLFPSVGIHGTIQPLSLYRYASHGCIRLHPEDVAALFARVTIGTAGVIRYQPVLIASIDGRVYLEAHPDVYRRAPDSLQFVRNNVSGVVDRVDWTTVLRVLKEQRGVAVDVTKED